MNQGKGCLAWDVGQWIVISCMLLLGGCVSTLPLNDTLINHSDRHIYVISEKWHSSILVKVEDVLPYATTLSSELLPYQYVCFGWGDGDYFTGKDKSIPTALKALVNSDYSALQVLGYYGNALSQFDASDKTPVAISQEGMQRLMEFVEASLLYHNYSPVPLHAFEENTGVFFQGVENYSAKNNCNTWVSRALQAAGLPLKRENFVHSDTIFNQVKTITDYQRSHGVLPIELE